MKNILCTLALLCVLSAYGQEDNRKLVVASNGLIYSENIKDALIRLDPENADIVAIKLQGVAEKMLQHEDVCLINPPEDH
jgi:hypothetical protein